MADSDYREQLVTFLRQQGFVWGPSPEVYGGSSGFYTYGPLGKLLKNNVEEHIRDVFREYEFMEVECPTVMKEEVWDASGHLEGFSDPMIKDTEGNLFRADTVIEDYFEEHEIQEPVPLMEEEILETIKEYDIKAPSGNDFTDEVKAHSLMMETTIGVDQRAFCRPETATTTYLPFRNYDFFFRGQYPFGVFQIGQAYRNEISPRKHLLRKREFTQAEAQLFILPDQKNDFERFKALRDMTLPVWTWDDQEEGDEPQRMRLGDLSEEMLGSEAYAWTLGVAYQLFKEMGIPENRMRVRQHGPDEKAFYAKDAWDIEIETNSFGWMEACGVHDRTDYDLKQHSEHGNEELETTVDGETVTPHILEIAFGTDRPAFALMDLFYDHQEEEEGKTVFRVPYDLAPRKVAVFPLHRKEDLQELAHDVYDEVRESFPAKYDETASIGKRYLRAGLEGIPWCVTVDYDSLDDDQVTIRDRDSEEQIRVPIDKLVNCLYWLYQGESLDDVKDAV